MKKIIQKIGGFLNPQIAFFGSLASIIALIIFFISSKAAVIVSLIIFILFLTAILINIIRVLNIYINTKYEKDFHNFSTMAIFSNEDGKHCVYEVFKSIQSKRLSLTEFDYNFKWSGSIEPKITSELQKVGHLTKNHDDYDRVKLNFKTPLLYNQIGVIHVKMFCNDQDGKASPHLELKVQEQLHLLLFRVELKHKDGDFKQDAILFRKKINSNLSEDYKQIETVRFDLQTKSYNYYITFPEVGYFYKLTWEK